MMKTWSHRAANSFSKRAVNTATFDEHMEFLHFFFSYILTIRPPPPPHLQSSTRSSLLSSFQTYDFTLRNQADFVSSAVPLCSSALVVPL
jgi:hypothetical protein